jgi:hypothetical protein
LNGIKNIGTDEVVCAPPVEDGKTLGGQGVEAGGPFDHGLRDGETVLTVQGQALVQTDQEDAEDCILVYRNLSID